MKALEYREAQLELYPFFKSLCSIAVSPGSYLIVSVKTPLLHLVLVEACRSLNAGKQEATRSTVDNTRSIYDL